MDLRIAAPLFAAPLARSFNQSGRRSSAKSVENSSHHSESDTQSTKANSSGGLQADFNNAGPFAVSRKVHRANVHLPSITTVTCRGLVLLNRSGS